MSKEGYGGMSKLSRQYLYECDYEFSGYYIHEKGVPSRICKYQAV